MIKELKPHIQKLFPEVKKALEKPGEKVMISEVEILRNEAQILFDNLEREKNSKSSKCQIDWNAIPLKLVVASDEWRDFRKSLNEVLYRT